MAGAADDQVVVDDDAELGGGAGQFLGHGDVGGRGLGLAAGVVVDQDEGGGTTGVGGANTGWRFIGMEMRAGYFEIAKRRIIAAVPANDNRPPAANDNAE